MNLALSLSLWIAAYAVSDLLLRRGWGGRALAALGLESKRSSAYLCAALALSAGWFISWQSLVADAADSHWLGPLRWYATLLGAMLAWNASTRDHDPTRGPAQVDLNVLLMLSALLVWVSPVFMVLTVFLLSHTFSFWLHHATFPMRVAQALVSLPIAFALHAACSTGLGSIGYHSLNPEQFAWPALVTFLVILQVSHYFITALAKMFLGPRWHSWVTDNQLHHLAASSYSWGWARFLPWSSWRNVIWGTRKLEKPLQFAAFSLELLSPLALLDQGLAAAFSVGFAAFHLGVFALSGLLFWDWIITDLLLAALLLNWPVAAGSIITGPPATDATALANFGWMPLFLGLVVMGLFPLRHKLWKPMPLGWFDTPLAARIHWEAIGKSGKVYELYNNFMCPHERLYGRVNGSFFVPHPVLSYHLGEVWKPEVRKGIVDAGACKDSLSVLRKKFGILPADPRLRARHLAFLQSFFSHLNAGATKEVLPRWARWLKAPGDQIFYWGHLPAYRRDEPVARVRLRFVEQYFDGEQHQTLHDQVVAEVDIPPVVLSGVEPELTPKELDSYLLGLAQGRLIDLPGAKKNYTEVLSEV